MITFLFLAGLLFLGAAVFYWRQPEQKIRHHNGDAFLASIQEPRNRRLHAKAMTQEKNLYVLSQARYNRLRIGVDLEHLTTEIQKRQLDRSVQLLELDHRYHLELQRQLQLLQPSENNSSAEQEQSKSDFDLQKTKMQQAAELAREAKRHAFDQVAEEAAWLNQRYQQVKEAEGEEAAEFMKKELLRKLNQNEFFDE